MVEMVRPQRNRAVTRASDPESYCNYKGPKSDPLTVTLSPQNLDSTPQM